MRKGLILTMAFVLMFGMLLFAGDKGEQKTLKGTLSCLGCDLKKDAGANAQCKIYGHDHALKLKDGSYVSFFENDHSEVLISANKGEWHGSGIAVSGKFIDKANVIDVKSFEIKDKNYSWCGGCKNMGQCQGGHGH